MTGRVPRVRLDALTEPLRVETLASEMQITVAEVESSLAELEAAGWIEPASGGRYWLTLPKDDPRGRP